MYKAIYIDKKSKPNKVHLWDDKLGYMVNTFTNYGYRRKKGGKFRSIYGDELERIENPRYGDQSLFSSDIPAETLALIDGYGDSDEISVDHCIASIDIETASKGGYPRWENPIQPITAIAIHENVTNKYWCWFLDPNGVIKNRETSERVIMSFANEKDLLSSFLDKWREINPTIATGFNIDGFDFLYLYARLELIFDEEVAGRLSPIGICYFNKFKNKMTIAGINCLDYLLLYKRYSQKSLPNFRLDTVAKEELGIGKIAYEGSLDDLMKNDPEKFIEYNINDVAIIEKLDKKLGFIELAMSICHVCHVGYEEFHVSSRFLEGAMLTYLHRKKLIAPNKKIEIPDDDPDEDDADADVGFEGAYVKEPPPGRYEWICSSDINSLYPSVIMTLNISPETKIGKVDGWDVDKFTRKVDEKISFAGEEMAYAEFGEFLVTNNLSVASNGVIYDQGKVGCIPDILKKWFSERVEFKNKAKAASDNKNKEEEIFWDRRQKVQKILLNSLYGVLGMGAGFRFADVDNAEAITLTGQTIIKTSERYVNSYLNKRLGTSGVDCIIAMDTDSLYINFTPLIIHEKVQDKKAFSIKTIGEISDKLNGMYETLVVRMFNSSLNRIHIAADVVASAAIWTSKKHYAMLKVYDMEKSKDISKLDIKGLDAVRSSYPKKFREFMKTILDDILRGTTKDELDAKIMEFRGMMKDFNLEDVAKNTGVQFVSRTEEKKNFNPDNRDIFSFVKGSTGQCKAALAYNDMLKHFNLTETEPIMSGGKIKWVYLRDNPFGLKGLAFKDDGKDPKQIMDFISTYIDRMGIWEAELESKLEDFYSALKWDMYSVDKKSIDDFFSF